MSGDHLRAQGTHGSLLRRPAAVTRPTLTRPPLTPEPEGEWVAVAISLAAALCGIQQQ